MSHRKTDLGILYPSKSAKVVLASLRRGFLLQRDAEGLGMKGVADYEPR
jgi:hypothetical protein